MGNKRVRSVFRRLTFGDRVPWAIGLLLTMTIAASLVAALGDKHELLDLGALVPERVHRGQIWRIVTWSFLEPDIFPLIIACVMLYWFGGDLARVWGSLRFVQVYLGIALFAAVGTCLLALVDTSIAPHVFVGSWPIAEALTVAWGLTYPNRVVRIYFVIPIRGVILAWGTVVLTVGFAIFRQWDFFVPSLLSEGAMLAWLYRRPVVSRWSAWRAEQKRNAEKARRRARVAAGTLHVLRQLEEHDDDLPPLPPELEGKLGRLIADGGKDGGKAGHPTKRDGEDKPN